MLTTNQAAAILGISGIGVRALIRRGTLKARQYGRDWMIEEADLEAVKNRKKGWPKGKPRKEKGE